MKPWPIRAWSRDGKKVVKIYGPVSRSALADDGSHAHMPAPRYTDAEVAWIRELFPDLSAIATKLGRSRMAIVMKTKRMGLHRS